MVNESSIPEIDRPDGHVQTDTESDGELAIDKQGQLTHRRIRAKDGREREQPTPNLGTTQSEAQPQTQATRDVSRPCQPDGTAQGSLTRDEVMQLFNDLKGQILTMVQQNQAQTA